MMTIPHKGYYMIMLNIRCYGGGTYPAIINIYLGAVSGDPDGGAITLNEYGWFSTCVLAHEDAGTHSALSLRNNTNSSNFNVRAKAILIYPT